MTERDWWTTPPALIAAALLAFVVLFLLVIPVLVAASHLVIAILTGTVTTLAPWLLSLAAVAVVVAGCVLAIGFVSNLFEQAKEHPLVTIAPVLTLLGGVASNLIASAVGFSETQALIYGALTALLFVAGGTFYQLGYRLGSRVAQALGVVLVVLTPTVALASIIVRSESRDIVGAFTHLNPITILLLALLLVAAIGVAYLLLRTKQMTGSRT